MANLISLSPGSEEKMSLSNGYTDVLIQTLALAASSLASSLREKEMTVWLVQHDQSVLGSGMAGFSLSDIPWNKTAFDSEKAFWLKTVDLALAETGWEKLGYTPGEHTPRILCDFKRMMEAFDLENINPEAGLKWREFAAAEYGSPMHFSLCPRHGILLHWRGCILCNAGLDE